MASRQATEARYAGYRAASFRKAEELLRPVAPAPLSLRPITPEALSAFNTGWSGSLERRYPWPWPEMAGDYRRNEPDRFEVAVWSGEALCGLCLGRLRADYCGGDYLEGSPLSTHPLRGFVLSAVLTALTVYAVALRKQQLRLINPVPEMVPHYENLGFVLASPKGEAPYCWKVIP